jgi:DNA-binding transcriptional LysR family regulator
MDDFARIQRRLRLQDLRILMAVVQAGSMSKAAERLSTSQPAISKTIADLEHVLGVRLLDRGPQGISPTPYGSALIKRGAAALDELRLGVEDVKFLADPASGEIRIVAPMALAGGLVSAAVVGMKKRYPRVMFRLTVDEYAASIFRRLEQREAELAFRYFVPPVSEESVDIDMLCDDRLVIVASADNPLSRRRRLGFAELMDEPWVLAPPDGVLARHYSDVFRSAGLEVPAASVLCTSGLVRLAMVARDRYLTILPESILRFANRDDAIKVLPVALPPKRLQIGALTIKNRTLTPAAGVFIGCARELAASIGRKVRPA